MRALVVGAGPAGLGAAKQLVSWCDKVIVIEARARTSSPRVGEHLPPTALTSIAQLGLDELMNDPMHTPSSGICSAWGASDVAERDYFFSPAGEGINLRREIFDETLTHSCEQSGVLIEFETRLSSLRETARGYQAIVRSPTQKIEIHADIIVDASGRNARAARQLGATCTREDTLIGIVGRVQCSKPMEDAGRLHIKSVEHGWWYTVQFSDGLLIGTYMTDAATTQRHEHGAQGLWKDGLADSGKLAEIAQSEAWPDHVPAKVSVFDASTQSLEKMTSTTFLAVGDAAVAFDPLSSWGITKGLKDGFEGAHALERQVAGEHNATMNHRSKQSQEFLHYRENRQRIYSAEQRWSDSPFWHTRQLSLALH